MYPFYIFCSNYIYCLFVRVFCLYLLRHDMLLGAILILLPIIFSSIMVILVSDICKARVEISQDKARIIDYYFCIRKEKTIDMYQISYIKKVSSYRFKTHGYSLYGTQYLEFRDANDKYLFKICSCPQTEKHFSDYIKR